MKFFLYETLAITLWNYLEPFSCFSGFGEL